MIANELTKTLLTANKDIFKYLSTCYGLDFEKPFIIKEFKTPFTLNQIEKETGSKHGFIIFIESHAFYDFRPYLYMVEKTGSTTINIELKHPWDCGVFNITSPSNYYAKKVFEAARKNKPGHNVASVIYISQDKQHARTHTTPEIVRNDRFYNCTFNHRPGYIYHNYYVEMAATQNGKSVKVPGKWYMDNYLMDQDDFIDKSGYLVCDKRYTLKKQAVELKSEKAKKACNNNDFEKECVELTNIKQTLINAIKTAFANAAPDKLSTFSGYGGHISRYDAINRMIDSFIKNVNGANFDDINQIQADYLKIRDKYNTLMYELKSI